MEITPLEPWVRDRLGAGSRPLTREAIEAWQIAKLHETVRRARVQSAFYRRHLAHLSERELSDLDALTRFPFTTAEDLREDPLQFLCVSQSRIQRVVTLQTSGTTGTPKRIYFTAEDQEATIDFFRHGMSTLVGPKDRVLILLPGERPGSVGDLLVAGLSRLGAVGIPHGPVRSVRSTLAVMRRERIDTLVGNPTQVLALARQGDGKAAVRSVLLSTDHVPDAIRRELEGLWGCEVFNHYGMTEMGFGGGVECRAHSGTHMRELDLYFEIIDPQTGKPVGEGETGEVVFTTLTRYGMPLIRYRTGDLSRFLPERCPCGTVLKTMERVRGRVGGRIELATGAFLTLADLDEALFPLESLLDFDVVFSREKGEDRLHIEAYVKDARGHATLDAIRDALRDVPCLRATVKGDPGFLSITVREEEGIFSRGAAKRTLIDRRADSRGEHSTRHGG